MPICPQRQLGNTGIAVSTIGFGAFKIGRRLGAKYPADYELPDDAAVERLLAVLSELRINLIDTAPAYGTSEDQLGKLLGRRRDDVVLCSKVGESFVDGQSVFDFSGRAVEASIEASLRRLKTDRLDVVHIHSDGNDVDIQENTDCVEALLRCKRQGKIRAIGLSGKTAEGFKLSIDWADTAMVEFSPAAPNMKPSIKQLRAGGVGVVVKKALGSGTLDADDALRFVLGEVGVASAVVGSLSADHLRANVAVAEPLG